MNMSMLVFTHFSKHRLSEIGNFETGPP